MNSEKKYISIMIAGGLGNQLFMVAIVYSIAYKYGLIPIFKHINISSSIFKNRPTYFDNILKKITVIDPEEYNKIEFTEINEQKSRKHNFNIDGSYKLTGYYQSEKHFIEYKEEIYNLFKLEDIYMDKIRNIYNSIKEEHKNKTTVSLHVRRGDYLKLSHFHTNLDNKYYDKAVRLFDNDILCIIFSDDIEWCKDNMKYRNMYICENIPDIGIPNDVTELMLMSMCDNNIIANSTFSWWGAWLNRNPDKKVIAPRNWFVNDMDNFRNNKIYCKGWKVI